MKIKTISASSADVYEKCPARFKASYTGERVQELASSAADIGTACHEALENYVGFMVAWGFETPPPLGDLLKWFDDAYFKLFHDRARYDEGADMLKTWHARMDWTGREVLSTEVKEHFDVPFDGGSLWATYIYDRCDKIVDGDEYGIEVIDYKTVAQPVAPGELKDRIQPRMYALAAQIKYPEAKWIKVTLDLLRFEPVGTIFTREDNIITWNYLKGLVARILADDGSRERVNTDCRWCIRRDVCSALRSHVHVGGPLSLDDPMKAADLRRELVDQAAAIGNVISDIDDFLVDWCRENDTTEFATEDTQVHITVGNRRGVDAERAAQVIGPELVAQHGSLTMAAVDKMLKGSELTPEQKVALRGLITRSFGAPAVKTKMRPPHEVSP